MKAPFKKGDWVARLDDDRPDIGQVIEYCEDDGLGDPWINIVLYDLNGNKIGRRSPPEGGPTSFEPCCQAKDWGIVREPCWPIKRSGFAGAWKSQLKFL